jgi:hypothetical protein
VGQVKPTVILFGLVFAASAVLAQDSSASLVRLGGISGENGLFALNGTRVSVYSDQSVYLQTGEDRTARLADHDGPVSVEIQNGSLQRTTKHLPKGQAHWFQLCDNRDQIANGSVLGMSAFLPKGVKIKEVDKLAGPFWLVVASSVVGTELPKTSIYLLREDAPRNFAVVHSDTVSESGFYCGIQSLGRDTMAILVAEIAKSNNANLRAIYFYQINRKESEGREMGKKSEK